MWVYFWHNQRLYKWDKWLYYINICINKTLYVVNLDTLCAALSCSLRYFYSSALMWLKTASQSLLIPKCFMCCLLRSVKQPEEGSPAAHRERGASPAIVASFSQSESVSPHPTNQTPFDPPQHWRHIPFRWHANYVPVRSWSYPIKFCLQVISPQTDFISRYLFSVRGR